MRGMHPPTGHFQKCFQCRPINFFVVSNLFDSDKPYALSSGEARNFKKGGSIISTFLGVFFFSAEQIES